MAARSFIGLRTLASCALFSGSTPGIRKRITGEEAGSETGSMVPEHPQPLPASLFISRATRVARSLLCTQSSLQMQP